MKKTLVSALTTALVVGAASTTFAAANPFSDVTPQDWAYQSVAQLAAAGVINGYPDGTFKGLGASLRHGVYRGTGTSSLADQDQTRLIFNYTYNFL